ncbi:MAG: hypothetical protein R3B47_03810 [Bacteroidia bacterium]
MSIKHFSSFLTFCWLAVWGIAQQSPQADTLPTESGSGHLFLSMDIPKGDFTLNSSGLCGNTVYKVFDEGKEMEPVMVTQKDQAKNLHQRFELVLPEQLQAKGVVQVASTSLEPRLISRKSENDKPIHTLYCPDPSIPTDMNLSIGRGHSRLDLSDMMINRLDMKSHFAEVFIQYNKPNRMDMEKMHVQSIQGKVVLKNLELARAELVTIENELDDTKIMVGNGKPCGTTVFVQQGMGDCLLYVHPGHPLKITVRDGLFTSSTLPPDFEAKGENTFVNQAWKAREEAEGDKMLGTTIICSFDMGKLKVTSMR